MEWLGFCGVARIHVLEAERLHIEQWTRLLAAGGNSRTTVATKLVPVCGFYRWAHQEGLTAADVAAYVRRPKRPRRSTQVWFSREEVARVLAVAVDAGPPVDLLVHLLALNGLRLGETLGARVEHLGTVEDQRTLRLPDRKAGVMDTVSLPAATVALLPAAVAGRDRGVLLRHGRRAVVPADVYRWFDVLGEKAGLSRPLRPHALRATFVTLALDAGVPARDVMASTGHADTAMVDYYDRAHAAIRRNASHRVAGWVAGDAAGGPL